MRPRNLTEEEQEMILKTQLDQKLRLLVALIRVGAEGVTTSFAREGLDIMCPAARVRELRSKGFDISTIKELQVTDKGHYFKGARYVLRRGLVDISPYCLSP